MTDEKSFGVAGSVQVVENGKYEISGYHIQLPLDEALSFHTEILHEVCYSEFTPLSQDFSTLLGAIKCADRSIMRHHAKGWSRKIGISVPVFELSTWTEVIVMQTLRNALHYLTGDSWNISFSKRKKNLISQNIPILLSIPDRRRIFMPFSHGLDSFAQSEILRSRDPKLDIIPIHLRSGKTQIFKRTVSSRGTVPIQVSASVSLPKHAELSFRSRPFLFDGLAGYAAALSGGGTVVIPENGQGSLGGSLVRLGSEAPHRSCHPGFTSRLSSFLEALTGTKVTFEHPALFHTKGTVLKDLQRLQPESDVWIKSHSSCSYDSRQSSRDGKKVHCGVCGNCLLRRVALHAADISDNTDYKFSNLTAGRLEDSIVGAVGVKNLSAFRDLARNGVRSMHRLANTRSRNLQYQIISEATLIAKYQNNSLNDVKFGLSSMLEKHGYEWNEFMHKLGPSSWIAEYAKE